MRWKTFYRINSLEWADTLVDYAFFLMQNYFTDVWKLSLTHAAAILNIWNGMYRILPVFFLYLVDSFLGHFKPLVFTTTSYSAGTMLVFMSLPPILANITHTCKAYEPECIGYPQVCLLCAGLALIAVGKAGNLVSIEPFLDEQRETDNQNHAKLHRVLGVIIVVILVVLGHVISYLGPWTLRFGIPAVFTVLCTLWFITGSRSYRREPPNQNGTTLFSTVCRVFGAAFRKKSRPYPDDNNDPRYHGINEMTFSSASYLRALHKAAIIEEDGILVNRTKPCSVAEVEEAKTVVRMLPVCMISVVCGIISSIGDTYFVEQAGNMNPRIGKIKLPIQVLLLTKKLSSYVLSKVGRPLLRWTDKAFRIALVMIVAILCCISAAETERMRLDDVRRHGLLDQDDEVVPMSMFWLLFQFVFLGSFESILEDSTDAYYRDQCPDHMAAYLKSFSRAMSGLGFMSSSLCVYVVGRISEMGGRLNWFQTTLNRSRLDRYYWVLAALSGVNLVVYVVVAWRYKKTVEEWGGELDTNGVGGSHADQNDVEMGPRTEGGSHGVEHDVAGFMKSRMIWSRMMRRWD